MSGKRPTVSSRHGIVAAAHPLAAAAGAQMLAKGGNAFDAIVATAAALNVVEPFMSSLAGMGLATCWVAKDKTMRALNFVSPVPAKFPVDRFTKRDELYRGAHAVGTPGNFGGWAEINARYGKLPLADCLEPAIRLARDGYAVTEFNVLESNAVAPDLAKYPDLYGPWAKNYTDGSGKLKLGWMLRQQSLSKTLEALAKHGPKHLYSGALGEALVACVQAGGGSVTMADMEAMPDRIAKAWHAPASARYRDLTVHVPAPPCEGSQMLQSLRILDGFDLSKMDNNGADHVDTVLRAIRLAAGDRIANNFADMAKVSALLGEARVAELRARVRDGKPITGPTEQWMPTPKAETHTTSMSAGDADGNLVCLTNSLGAPYGAGVIVPDTGLCLNNFLFWADVQAQSPNRTKPGAVLPMCMSPSISMRGNEAVLALGTPGSYGIMQTQVQALVQHVDFGHSLQDAIEQPRVRLWDGRAIEPETRLARFVLDELRRRGHEIMDAGPWTMKVGGMQGVARDPATGIMTGGCDPRRDGYVVPV